MKQSLHKLSEMSLKEDLSSLTSKLTIANSTIQRLKEEIKTLISTIATRKVVDAVSVYAYHTNPNAAFPFKILMPKALYMHSMHLLGHYLVKSCFSSEISKHGMRAGGSLPLSIICKYVIS